MVTRLCSECTTTANPDRATDRTGARAASTFLTPGLRTAATDSRAILLCFRTCATAREVGRNNLVNQRFVERNTECTLGNIHGTLTFHFNFHRQGPQDFALIAGRTITRPPFDPGTAPRINNRLRSLSTRTTTRFCTVRRTLPMWPAIFLPLKTRPGVWF